jgi:hypothetical protein
MMPVYRYLNVRSATVDIVSFPDGSQQMVPAGEGSALAASWRQAQAAAQGPEAARAAAQAAAEQQAAAEADASDRRREWETQLKAALRDATSVGHARMLREDFVLRVPEPPAAEPPAQERHEPPGLAGVPHPVVTAEQSIWSASLDDGPEQRTFDLGRSPDLPRTALAELLSQLGVAGWRISHLHEEKRVVHSGDESRAVVDGVWVLLERHASPEH